MAQRYADFLGSLPHGDEISTVSVTIGGAAEISRRCGGGNIVACYTTGAGNRMFVPGDESSRYEDNPGEAWAEAYARLSFEGFRWPYAASLEPDSAALRAARRDVLAPWTRRRARTFTGTGARVQRFKFDLKLDGEVDVELTGDGSYEMKLLSDGKTRARTTTDRIRFAGACRSSAVEHITLSVVRRAGSGTISLRVAYPG